MAYERLNLEDGVTLNADHIKHLEDGIVNATQEKDKIVDDVLNALPKWNGGSY